MRMAKKRSFGNRVTIALSQEQIQFLQGLIEKGEVESFSQAIRKCINIAMKSLQEK
jgi:Arc/MetJ-type ribon-helix-helix transcriptional regulator